MNIALIDNGQVTAVGDYRALFPQTSFPPDGPSDEFLAANSAMKVNVWLPYDQMTEKLAACPPYIDGDWVYTVEVIPLTPEDIAAMDQTQQALYNSRPAWAVAATALAVWAGAAGCIGLILRKSWSLPLLLVSLAGVAVQDIGLFVLSGVDAGPAVMGMQGVVLLIAIGLVVLARKAIARRWIA